MKKDIIEIALEEAKMYIRSLQTKNIFQQVIDKYVRLHNKNIFIDFTFNSLDARSLFQCVANTYGCQVGIVTPKFSRDKNIVISNLQNKVRKQKKALYEEERNVSKLFSSHQEMIQEMGLEKQLKQERNIDAWDIQCHFEQGNTIPLLESVLQYEKEKIEQKSKNYDVLSHMLKQTKEHTRYIEHAVLSVENMFFTLVLERYFKSIETYARDMFGSSNVYVQYSKKSLWESFEKMRKKEYKHIFGNEQYTAFEMKIIQFLEDKYNDFVFRVHHEGEIFQIGNGHRYTNYQHKKEENNEYWERRWDMLVKSHPEFIASIRTFALLQQSSDSQKVSAKIVHQYIHRRYSEKLLKEYQKIVNGLQQKEQKEKEKFHHPSLEEMLQNMKRVFPHMRGEMLKEPWSHGGYTYYNETLLYVQSDSYHVQMYKVKELKPM